MNKLFNKLFVILFIIGFFVLLLPLQKVSADEGTLGAYPTNYDPSNPLTKSWFIYELKPGETKHDSITVLNMSDKKIVVKIYAVDATTTSDGAFALLNENQQQNEIGKWVTLTTNLVMIDPKSHYDIPFTIHIPNNVTVGDHAGGIIVQQAIQNNNITQGIGLNIVSRVGTRIYETVPGNRIVSLDLQNLNYKIENDHLVFTFTLTNNGNVILTPTGTLEIKDSSGKSLDKFPLYNLGSIFPGKPITVTERSTIPAPWFGKFSATVTVKYSSTKEIVKTLTFFIFAKDWRVATPIIAIGLFALLYLFVLRPFYLKKKFRFSDRHSSKKVFAPSVKAQPKISLGATPAYAPAIAESVDAIFISRHIKLLVLIATTIIVILSGLFAFALQDFVLANIHQNGASVSPSTAPAQQQLLPTEKPIPTSIPVDKSTMKINVLNGSGVVGAAGTVKNTLTKDGFIVSSIGNADTVSQTEIQYPADQKAGADLLKQELQANYTNIVEVATNSSSFTITLGE